MESNLPFVSFDNDDGCPPSCQCFYPCFSSWRHPGYKLLATKLYFKIVILNFSFICFQINNKLKHKTLTNKTFKQFVQAVKTPLTSLTTTIKLKFSFMKEILFRDYWGNHVRLLK